MVKFTAKIAARTIKSSTGKVFSYPAYEQDFEQNEAGRWYTEIAGKKESIFEAEVIDVCKEAVNWKEIRAKYFPMVGFHN